MNKFFNMMIADINTIGKITRMNVGEIIALSPQCLPKYSSPTGHVPMADVYCLMNDAMAVDVVLRLTGNLDADME